MVVLSKLILFWFEIIYIHSDVPFMQHINMYQVIRTGRKRWALGQLGGIFIRSAAMTLFVVACTILSIFSKIEWTNDWGKLLHTASMTYALSEYKSPVIIYYEIFSEFTPLQAMGILLLLCSLISTFLGVLMFAVSIYLNKICAVACSMALAIALFPVINLHPSIRQKLAFFIPTVWVEIARIATPDHGYFWLPPVSYMLAFLITGIFVMTILILLRVKNIEFNWENEDV